MSTFDLRSVPLFSQLSDDDIERLVLEPAAVLEGFPEIRVDETVAFQVRNGREVSSHIVPDDALTEEFLRISDRDGKLIAM